MASLTTKVDATAIHSGDVNYQAIHCLVKGIFMASLVKRCPTPGEVKRHTKGIVYVPIGHSSRWHSGVHSRQCTPFRCRTL